MREAFEQFSAVLAEEGIAPLDPPSLTAVASALPLGGALAVPIVTGAGGAILILRHNDTSPDILLLNDLTTLVIDQLLSGWVVDQERLPQTEQSELAVAMMARNAAIATMQDQLGKLLMTPLDARLRELGLRPGAEIVLMVPGRLALLPLHAARIGEPGSDRIFLDDWIVSQVPSLNALLASRQRTAARALTKPSLLAITNPTEDIAVERNPAWDAFAGSRRRELRGAAAKVEDVSTALPGWSHNSYYGHGKGAPPVLVMAENKLLPASALRELNLSASRLLVLGACESGFTEQQVPDEFVGFPAAALEAGLPGVIASLWSVDAQATEELLKRFFARHLKGATPAEALREVVLEMRRGAHPVMIAAPEPVFARLFGMPSDDADPLPPAALPPDYTPPFYWAAFIITGA